MNGEANSKNQMSEVPNITSEHLWSEPQTKRRAKMNRQLRDGALGSGANGGVAAK